MVDLDWNTKMGSTKTDTPSPKLAPKVRVSVPVPVRVSEISPASSSSCGTYEHYLRLPDLRKVWSSRDFPGWRNEPVLKPALSALEITFRFVSTVLSDPRPYSNRREWCRRLEALASSQVRLVAVLAAEDGDDAPVADESSATGVLARDSSSAELWNNNAPGSESGSQVRVSRASEASLLPRLATWHKSEDLAQKLMYTIESEFRNCPYTLGLGEPNLSGKPTLQYDAVCRPNDIHALKKSPYSISISNHENQTLYATHQILESWIKTATALLTRIDESIETKRFEHAATDCYTLEQIWNLLAQIEDLHLLMDPNDFLQLKNQLGIKNAHDSELFCFRSKGLVSVAKQSKDLKHNVPLILGVEVDPKGGPRIQEAAMRLYKREKSNGEGGFGFGFEKVHLLQALQAVEAAMKRFFFGYKQVLVVVMGSLEAEGNRVVPSDHDSCDSLGQIFLEPTYFPSLDAAKTFLGHFWSHEQGRGGVGGAKGCSLERRTRRKQ